MSSPTCEQRNRLLYYLGNCNTQVVRVLNGTAKIPDGKVRMLSIVWRYKLDPEEIAKRRDFVLASGHFESTELLNNSHWTIYTIERVRMHCSYVIMC